MDTTERPMLLNTLAVATRAWSEIIGVQVVDMYCRCSVGSAMNSRTDSCRHPSFPKREQPRLTRFSTLRTYREDRLAPAFIIPAQPHTDRQSHLLNTCAVDHRWNFHSPSLTLPLISLDLAPSSCIHISQPPPCLARNSPCMSLVWA